MKTWKTSSHLLFTHSFKNMSKFYTLCQALTSRQPGFSNWLWNRGSSHTASCLGRYRCVSTLGLHGKGYFLPLITVQNAWETLEKQPQIAPQNFTVVTNVYRYTWKPTLLLWPWGSPKERRMRKAFNLLRGLVIVPPPHPRNSPAPLPPLNKYQWSETLSSNAKDMEAPTLVDLRRISGS